MPKPGAQEIPEGIAAEDLVVLRDAENALWRSKAATVAWLRVRGFPTAGEHKAVQDMGPYARHRFAVTEWAKVNGFTRPTLPKLLDHARLYALGLQHSNGKVVMERLGLATTNE